MIGSLGLISREGSLGVSGFGGSTILAGARTVAATPASACTLSVCTNSGGVGGIGFGK